MTSSISKRFEENYLNFTFVLSVVRLRFNQLDLNENFHRIHDGTYFNRIRSELSSA